MKFVRSDILSRTGRNELTEDELHEVLNKGWLNGLKIIQKIMANARYFTDNSVTTVWDVCMGNCSVGIVVDFYGRHQRELTRSRGGSDRLRFVLPKGGSCISPDPIAMFRGAPHRSVAQAFIEYVVSAEGQERIGFKTGTPHGPQYYALHRTPMRKDFYKEEKQKYMSTPDMNPFSEEDEFPYQPQWTGTAFGAIRMLSKVLFGHYLIIKDKGCENKCYYSLKTAFDRRTLLNLPEEELINTLDAKLQNSVKDRMICEVPIGAFLSGGIDSSLMVALMQTQSKAPIKTFTVGFKGDYCDESKYAEAIAKYLKTDHTTVYILPEELWESATEAVDAYDEPFGDASAIGTYVLSKQFKKHVTVAIGGDGGDELFLGYHRHKWLPYLSGIGKWFPNSFLKFCEKTNDVLFSCRRPILHTQLNKGLHSLKAKHFIEAYINSVSYWSTRTNLSNTWFHENESLGCNAEQVSYLDLRTFLHDDVLCKVDRASMAVGLETRAPFLDYKLSEFAMAIPLNQKFKNHDKKYLLKRVLSKYIPQSLWDRPKMGFGMPLAQALRTSLKMDFDNLLKKDTVLWKYLAKSQVQRLWNEHLINAQNNELLLWNFYVAQRFLLK